jgi:putative ABC transport system substrate-binding protein
MMDRRTFLGTLASGLIAAPLAAEAQRAGKVWRLGVLDPGLPPTEDDWQRSGLVLRLREAGYAEHQNLAFERRYAGGKIDRLPALAAELVQLKVDVIYTGTTPAVQAARMATGIIPIVFVAVGDPVGSGLVTSLARPGGNVTGVSAQMADLGGKQLQLLKECVPGTRRVAVLWNPANVASAQGLENQETITRSLGMAVIPVAMTNPEDLSAAFSAMTRNRPDAMFVHPTAPMWERRLGIMEFALMHKLPTFSGDREMARAGALMTLGPDLQAQRRQAAVLIDKILKGAKPADLPVEQPTKFELVINLKTAKALGLTIPPSLLQRADQVIE